MSLKKDPKTYVSPQRSDNWQSSHASGLSLTVECCQIFDSESTEGIHSRKISPMKVTSSGPETDLAFFDSFEGGNMSINVTPVKSLSINVSPVKPGKMKKSYNRNRGGLHNEFSKHRGKTRRKQTQFERKQTTSRTSKVQKKESYAKAVKREMSVFKEGAHKQETEGNKDFHGNFSTAQKRCHERTNQPERSLGMFMKTIKVSTLEEQKKMLWNEGDMFFVVVTDQEGSRFLQEWLTLLTAEELWSSFTYLKSNFVTICLNVFGNYVAQKFINLGTKKLKSEVVQILQSSIYSLAMGTYGCRVVQKLLECEGREYKQVVANELSGSILNLVYDKNGNHVVQKMIQCLNSNEISFVADEIIGKTYSLAKHPYGSRVIQRLLEKLHRTSVQPLLNEIKEHTVTLSKNQYGNYIIQWIIKNCIWERREIVSKLIGRVAELSREKFSSNVIEEAFKRSSQDDVRALAKELLLDVSPSKGRYSPLVLLVNDEFGNYVVQTLVESSTGNFRQKLVHILSKYGKLNKNYGKKLLAKVGQISLPISN